MMHLVHLEPPPASGAQLDVVHPLVVDQVDLLPPVDLGLLDVSGPGKKLINSRCRIDAGFVQCSMKRGHNEYPDIFGQQ